MKLIQTGIPRIALARLILDNAIPSPNPFHHLRLPGLSRIGARNLDLATGMFAIVHLCFKS
jgi:hypothetical protein